MSTTDDDLTKLYVDLPNHWATGGESMWARVVGPDLYEIDNVPFYRTSLSGLEARLPEVMELTREREGYRGYVARPWLGRACHWRPMGRNELELSCNDSYAGVVFSLRRVGRNIRGPGVTYSCTKLGGPPTVEAILRRMPCPGSK